MSEKRWDVFISHAHEDKTDVALPLAELLVLGGLEVWLDRLEVGLGQSIRRSVDEGLFGSSFGVVVLSPHALKREWVKREIDALFGLEEGGEKVIIPVWHDVTKADVQAFSPILADRLSVDTRDGLPQISRRVIDLVKRSKRRRPETAPRTAGNRLIALLERRPAHTDVVQFMQANSSILTRALSSRDELVVWNVQLGDTVVDACVGDPQPTIGMIEWQLMWLLPVDSEIMDDDGEPVRELADALAGARAVRRWMAENQETARRILKDASFPTGMHFIIGRRGAAQRRPDQYAQLRDEMVMETIRTYDWLVEVGLRLE